MEDQDRLARQYLEIPIEYSRPNVLLGDPHPVYDEAGEYMFELSPMTDEDEHHNLHPNSTTGYFNIPISEIENYRGHFVCKYGFTSTSIGDRGSYLPNELVIGKNYPPDQLRLILRHALTGLLPETNFLHDVENAMRNRLRRFRMRYHARGMTRYARDRCRHSESFEYVTFTRDSLNVQEVFTLMRDDANRGRRSARNVVAREDRRRQREIQDEMTECRRRQRAVTEHCRSSHRAAVRALHRRLLRDRASPEQWPVRYSSCEQDRNAELRVFDFNLQERERDSRHICRI